jgi:DNA-binding NtrC family response regulator
VIESGEFEPVGSSKTITVDVRLISATNADLPALGAQGEFREDLLYRLNAIEVKLPPLRERIEDLPPLANFFLARRYRRHLI